MSPTSRRIVRLATMLAALGCGCVPFVIALFGDWTPLKLSTVAVSVVAALGLFSLAVGPQSWWSTLAASAQALQHVSTTARHSRDVAWGRGLIAVAFVLATTNLCWRLYPPDDPWDGDDQGAYLSVAREIAADGGPGVLFRQLFGGRFVEANRHPLYLGLLALQPTEVFGRYLSASFALAAFGLVIGVAWRRFGPWQAGLVAILLAVNSAWGRFGSLIVCESLILLLASAVWWQCLRWSLFEDLRPETASDSSRRRHFGPPLLTGALLGLCYLTKGTGVLLLGCILAWFMIEHALRMKEYGIGTTCLSGLRHSVLLLAAFALVASPLLVRNVRLFGQAFHNVNTYLLFADHYEEFEELLESGASVGQVAKQYLQEHSLADLAKREASGAIWEAFIIVRMLGPAPWDDARFLFGMPVVCLALLGLARAPASHRRWFIVWVALQWLVYAWYVPIAAGERFVLPILAPTLVYAAEGWCSVGALWRTRLAARGHSSSALTPTES